MKQLSGVKESLHYIDQNLKEEITLEKLARKACCSKYYFHRLFHKATGETVGRYVARKRMESAAKELAETDSPIIEIALSYQYGSQEAFSRAFKKVYSVSPGSYRRESALHRQSRVIKIPAYRSQIVDRAA